MHPSRSSATSRLVLLVVVALFVASCGGATSRPSEVDPTGPPELRTDVVAEHAAQLDEELGDRPAGSQREQAASQYVLGHLQLAGYFVQLDAVPVANLVESTNLLALPPGGEEAETVVAVAYDADEGSDSGEAVGVFLELARALYVAEPDHRVEFVALGAERTDEHLGSRRLAQQLREEGRSPDVITLVSVPGDVGVTGELAAEIKRAAEKAGVETGAPPAPDSYGGVDVFERAGFASAVVGGGSDEDLGAVLLAYLAGDDG